MGVWSSRPVLGYRVVGLFWGYGVIGLFGGMEQSAFWGVWSSRPFLGVWNSRPVLWVWSTRPVLEYGVVDLFWEYGVVDLFWVMEQKASFGVWSSRPVLGYGVVGLFWGIQQGSVSGRLLFLLQINDMHRSSNQISFVHIADDTTVFASDSDINNVHVTVNRELVGFNNCLNTNRLSLNVGNTSYMIIFNQEHALNIKIRESILMKVSTVKFHGATFDENITFKDHVNKVTSNISKSVGVMRRLHCPQWNDNRWPHQKTGSLDDVIARNST